MSVERRRLVAVLKTLQLSVSLGLVVLIWLTYPGLMGMLGSLIGLCYVIASIEAIRDRFGGIWLAFAFSAICAGLTAWGAVESAGRGFDFVSARYAGGETSLTPYMFLGLAVAAGAVVALHAASWPWMIRPRSEESGPF